MGRKIKIFHTEVEIKLLLEVLGVYVILALVLAGMLYLEPTITGFVAADQSLSLYLSESIIDDGNWIISFYTGGSRDLEISSVMGSYYEMYDDDFSTRNQIKILELRCGDYEIFNTKKLIETEGVWFVLEDGSGFKLSDLLQSSVTIKSVYVEEYECNSEISYLTVGIEKEGEYIQEIRFGTEKVYPTNLD